MYRFVFRIERKARTNCRDWDPVLGLFGRSFDGWRDHLLVCLSDSITTLDWEILQCRQRKHVSHWTATAFAITIASISAPLGNRNRRLSSSQLMKERNFSIRAHYKVAIAATKCKYAFRTCCIFKLNANATPNECIWLALNGAVVRLCLSPCDIKM